MKLKCACNLNVAPLINFEHIMCTSWMSGSSIKLTNCYFYSSNGKFDDFDNGPKKSWELLCACHNHNHERRAYVHHLTSSKQKRPTWDVSFSPFTMRILRIVLLYTCIPISIHVKHIWSSHEKFSQTSFSSVALTKLNIPKLREISRSNFNDVQPTNYVYCWNSFWICHKCLAYQMITLIFLVSVLMFPKNTVNAWLLFGMCVIGGSW